MLGQLCPHGIAICTHTTFLRLRYTQAATFLDRHSTFLALQSFEGSNWVLFTLFPLLYMLPFLGLLFRISFEVWVNLHESMALAFCMPVKPAL